jgi:hypothetical protein
VLLDAVVKGLKRLPETDLPKPKDLHWLHRTKTAAPGVPSGYRQRRNTII